MEQFGDLLHRHRLALEMTQESLARQARISVQAIGLLERGDRRFPHRDTLGRLADALELNGTRRAAFLDAAARPDSAEQEAVDQLPSDVPDFTGRTDQLAEVLTALTEPAATEAVRVVVVAGGPGTGKSALAVRAAHQIAGEFPDGRLYLDLAGTSDQPRDPAVLLSELLGSLRVTGGAVPDGAPARATLFRSLLVGRKILLVLDDAAGADQIRPLLPPNGECVVLVTSRSQLTDVAGARHIKLEMLTPDEAGELFTTIVGADRVAAEPAEVEPILQACGYLPLAIRIAGGRLLGRPAWPLRLLRKRLDDESKRLNELRLGELGVRASFAAGIGRLPDDAVLAFKLLGLLGPRTVPGWVLGPLLDRADADDVLDTLVDANLLRFTEIDVNDSPRYRLHDLLRAYAHEGAMALPEAELRAAVGRLLATWLDLTVRAVDRLPPSLFAPPQGNTPRTPLPESVVDGLLELPGKWFEAERDALIGAVELAAAWQFDEAAWELAAAAVPYHDLHSNYEDWRRAHTVALDAARTAGNVRGEAVMLRALSQVAVYRDEYDVAADGFGRALELSQQAGDKREEFLARAGLGTIHRVLGRFDKAESHILDALEVVPDRHLEAQVRNALGVVLLAQDRPEESRESFAEALRICREIGDTHREAVVLREASVLYDKLGETEQAFTALRRALEIFESLDDERCVGYTLLRMGKVYAVHGELGHATVALQRAGVFLASNGNRLEEAECWQIRGELAAQYGMPNAEDYLTRALRLWQSVGSIDQVAEVQAHLDRLAGQ
jgi:tetratricopeptide (TPR) repeat protein/transcriptional regulator with XRE-family HTH domain